MPNGCLEWTRSLTNKGYGRIVFQGQEYLVHRLVARLNKIIDSDDSSLDVMHKCDNRKCFEVQHLIAGTRRDNMLDASTKGRLKRTPKTVCKRGHELTEENTQIQRGRRRCKTCKNLRQQFSRAIKTIL